MRAEGGHSDATAQGSRSTRAEPPRQVRLCTEADAGSLALQVAGLLKPPRQ